MARTEALEPSKVFADRVREVRERKFESGQAFLAELKDRTGIAMDRAVLTRIEQGQRPVSIDEAFAFAAALGLSPVHLLVPLGSERVAIGPKLRLPARHAREWIRGQAPLRAADAETFYGEVSADETKAMAATTIRVFQHDLNKIGEGLNALQDKFDAAIEALTRKGGKR